MGVTGGVCRFLDQSSARTDGGANAWLTMRVNCCQGMPLIAPGLWGRDLMNLERDRLLMAGGA